jgi:hypothetical protein
MLAKIDGRQRILSDIMAPSRRAGLAIAASVVDEQAHHQPGHHHRHTGKVIIRNYPAVAEGSEPAELP